MFDSVHVSVLLSTVSYPEAFLFAWFSSVVATYARGGADVGLRRARDTLARCVHAAHGGGVRGTISKRKGEEEGRRKEESERVKADPTRENAYTWRFSSVFCHI